MALPVGSQDFVQYWSAFQVAVAGGNPYDPAAISAVQLTLDPSLAFPIMMWNPPWLLVLLWPLLSLSWDAARVGMMALSLVCALAAGVITGKAVARWRGSSLSKPEQYLTLVASAFFYPVIDSLQSGQLGVLFAVCFSLFLLSFVRDRFFTAGLFLSLLCIKPHLFLIFFFAVLIADIRRFRVLPGIAVGLLAQVLAAIVLFPGLLTAWYESFGKTFPASVPTVLTWRSDFLVGFLRGIGADFFAFRADSLIAIVPLLGCFFVGVWFFRYSAQLRVKEILILICVSILFAPYGWVSDLAVLLPVFIFFLLASSSNGMKVFLISIQLIFLGLRGYAVTFHQFSFLLPSLFLWVLLQDRFGEKIPKNPSSPALSPF